VLDKGKRRIAVECKASSTPDPSPGFSRALHDLDIRESWIVAPVREGYPLSRGVAVTPLREMLERFAAGTI
jgi:hypothetical protein